jgi:hypothetical protein
MKSLVAPRFWSLLNGLPQEAQVLAKKNYDLWLQNPQHPSLHYKRLAGAEERFSVRVGNRYRAIGWKPSQDTVQWLWIGTHAEYDAILKGH